MRRRVRDSFMMPRVHRVTAPSGLVKKYHRKTRARLPSDIPEDHPDFIAAWSAEEAKGGRKRRRGVSGSVVAGCEAYLASRDHQNLSDGYRPIIRRHVDAIRAQASAAPKPPMMADLNPKHISADLSPLSPAVASCRLKAWRKLGAFWEARGWTNGDVTAGVKRKPMPKTDGHIEWTPDDIDQFRDHWGIGTPQRTAFELLQWTGARASDVVRLGPQMIQRNGLLRFRQKKTGVWANIPWTAPAFGLEAQRKDLMACAALTVDLIWIQTQYGKARSHKAFSSWFSGAATDAGLPDLSAHGLRKYRMNQLAEAGAPLLGMQSWVGHITLDEVQHYTQKADRKNVFFVNSPSRGSNYD